MQTHMILWYYAAVPSSRDRMPRLAGPGWVALAVRAWRRWYAPI
jgi:hypothetical protein